MERDLFLCRGFCSKLGLGSKTSLDAELPNSLVEAFFPLVSAIQNVFASCVD